MIVVPIGFIFYLSFFNYLRNVKNFSYKTTKSILILTNSISVSTGCFLYMNNYIPVSLLLNFYRMTLGFYLSDLIMMYDNEPLKIYITKICHHLMAGSGTLYSHLAPLHSCYFYITEIVNLPIELRFVIIEHNYKKYYLEEIASFLTYTLFFYTRIYKGYYFISDTLNYREWDIVMLSCIRGIYVLWWYLFYLINKKVFEMGLTWYRRKKSNKSK